MRTRPPSPASLANLCSSACRSLLPSRVQERRGAPSGLALWQTNTWRSNAGKACSSRFRYVSRLASRFPFAAKFSGPALCTPGARLRKWILTMSTENLLPLKDDMVAFIEGHGLKRLPGYVTEDIPSIVWEGQENPDAWKDFVEMAKHVGSPFVTFSEMTLEREELDALIEEAGEMNFPDEEATELVEAQWLRKYAGMLGYVQLGFVYQGTVFLHETTTEWYERFQTLLEDIEAFQDIVIDDAHAHDDDE